MPWLHRRWKIPGHITTSVIMVGISQLCACHTKPSEPVTLRYSHSWQARPDDLAKMALLSQRFNQETGLLIKHIPTPESTHDYLELCRKLLGAGPSGTDLLSIDLIWSPLLASDLMDLRPHIQTEIEKMALPLLDSYTVSGKLTAAPFNVPRGGLEYREDLLRQYGYGHPPRTWDELEAMAQRIQAGERARGNKDFWGYVWQGVAAEALTCNALEWQASEGAGRIIEKDQRISVNNPRAIRAWERARKWVGWISPPGVLAYRERDSMNLFDSGKAAFHRLWLITPITRVGQEQHIYWRSSRSVVPSGFTHMPAGVAGVAGTLGGNALAVSRHTPHPQEAVKLVQFLIRAQIEEGEKKSGGLPAQPNFYNSPHQPGSSGPLHALRASEVVTRPAGARYEQVTHAYFTAVHSVLAREKEAAQAAAELETELIRITGFSTGPPQAFP